MMQRNRREDAHRMKQQRVSILDDIDELVDSGQGYCCGNECTIRVLLTEYRPHCADQRL
jgi:hypothetical protein